MGWLTGLSNLLSVRPEYDLIPQKANDSVRHAGLPMRGLGMSSVISFYEQWKMRQLMVGIRNPVLLHLAWQLYDRWPKLER